MKITSFCLVCLLASMNLVAQPKAGKKAGGATPQFKAIWEPVPYPKDIDLYGIACVGAENCYAVGDKGTVIFTSDGGKKWTAQLGGDPESNDDRISYIHFLDAKTGWVMSRGAKILGTRDGSTWAELSKVSGTSKGVWFYSPQAGLELENPSSQSQTTVQRSVDGGKTWAKLSVCQVDTTVDGLARKLPCMLATIQFLSPGAGLAGGGAAMTMGTNAATFAKTGDGGQTWATSVIPESKYSITDVKFWNEREGIVGTSRGEEMFWTADGGATWSRSVKQRIWPSVVAVGGEGKIIVDVRDRGINYSFNGGRNFSSRAWSLPAAVEDVTFPDATHGYLVGRHGMVYRYRIVPFTYTSQGMLGAMAP